MKWGLTILLSVSATCSFGQLIFNSGMQLVATDGTVIATSIGIDNLSTAIDLSNASLVLAGNTAGQTLRTSTPLSILNLTIANASGFGLSGNWTVTKGLNLTAGRLSPTSNSVFLFTGTESDVVVSSDPDNSSYVSGRLYRIGTGSLSFPIGNADGYFPVRLENVSAADQAIPLGFEVIKDNPANAPASFVTSPEIKDIFSERYWEFSVGGTGTFSGNTTLSVSNNKADQFGSTEGDVTILEKSSTGDQKDLSGGGNNAFITSGVNMTATGKYYALAKTDEIKIKIHKLITPDNDSKNDVLVIEGIDSSPNNKVTLIDRWGVPVKVWDGFKNYPEPAGPSQDFDFSKLAIGNYICVAEYDDRGVRKNKKQMISVLK